MTGLRRVGKSAGISLVRWFGSSKSLAVAFISLVFGYYIYIPVTRYALLFGEKIPPASFLNYLSNGHMWILHSALTVFLFSDIMNEDEYSLWSIQRAGRLEYYLGQWVFVVLLSGIYTVFLYLISVLMSLPVITSFSEWGRVFYTLGRSSADVSLETGLVIQGTADTILLDSLQPLPAVIYELMFLWMGSVLSGMIMVFFTTVVNRISGIVVNGIFIFLSIFSNYTGMLVYGPGIV